MLDLAISLNGLTEKVTIWKDTLEAKDLPVNMIKTCPSSAAVQKKRQQEKSGITIWLSSL